jgi:hypothetical protein
VQYAATRGASLSVDINDEDYVFMYRDAKTSEQCPSEF